MRWGLIFILACCSLCDCVRAEENGPDALPSLGCYTDSDSQRDLPEQHQDFKLVSKHYCLDYCRASGYLYFGMQSGTWCNCGDSYGRYERVSRGECNQLCPDGATGNETCGGAWLNEIFPTGVARLLDDGMNSSEYLGCFNDSINSQQLPLRRQFGSKNSPHYCNSFCKSNGFIFSALQNKDWCLCGNAHSRQDRLPESLCDQPCREEPGKFCGGVGVNMLFSTGVPHWATKGGEKIGCFTDSSDRDLPLVLNAGQMASRQHCWHQCVSRGYAYFGLQAASFCTCGNVYGRYGKLADDRCSMTCAGAWDQTCGAGMVNEVFSTGLPEWTDRSVIRVGCFVDAASRDLPLHRKFTDGADRFSCWQFCYQRGYKYFGLQAGSQCFCGNQFGRHGRAGSDSECGTACHRDASKTCGGSWRNEIFATGIERMAENAIARLGCYQDGSVRDLQLLHEAGSATSRLACWHYCKLRGYRYFGLQAGRYCACGNSYGRHGVAPESHCSVRCPADDRQTCGNRYKNEVFTTGLPPDWETGVVRLGCFVDKHDRDMPVLLDAGHLASKYHCWTYCRSNGYKYFGLQDGTMCTCGNAYGRHGQVVDSDCNKPCRGDSSITCGGHMKNEIFITGIQPWDANVTRQGCFKAGNDSSTDLPLVQRTGSSTRRQHCWQFCESRGYRYFGLQSGDLCACGNSVRRLGQVDDAECNVRCRGFAGETCGGENHTEVFTTGVGAWDSVITSLGCFEDRADRDMVQMFHAKENCHKYFCWNYCRSKGYMYFGLQSGSWCTCGNVFSRFKRKNISECSTPCKGDPTTNCGGTMRNQLFMSGINQWEKQVTSLGCFEVSPNNRSIPVVHRANSFDAGRRYCWHYCRSRSYKYFAVRDELTCLCANWYDRFGLVEKSGCGDDCMKTNRRTSSVDTTRDTIEAFHTGIEVWETAVTRLGCFLDVENSRDFPVHLDAGNKLTKKFCWSYCQARGHKYFALQNRRHCYCGGAYGRHGGADDSECSERCRGDTSTTCGGELRNEVFSTGIGDWDRNTTRQGCFNDAAHPDLPMEHNLGSLANRYSCWKLCSTRGYKYFGLQNRQKCYCGNSFGRYGVALGSGACQERCSGDASATCGGDKQNEVFSTGLEDWDNGTASAMGCFIDKPDDPDFASGLHHLGEAATRLACWRRCRSLGWRYFAMQASQWCACGNSFGRHGRADRDCRLPCLGDPISTCGGHQRNEVFSTGL